MRGCTPFEQWRGRRMLVHKDYHTASEFFEPGKRNFSVAAASFFASGSAYKYYAKIKARKLIFIQIPLKPNKSLPNSRRRSKLNSRVTNSIVFQLNQTAHFRLR